MTITSRKGYCAVKWFSRFMLIAMVLCCAIGCACAQTLVAHVPVAGGMAEVSAVEIDGETWLLLPSFASVDALSLSMDGQAVFLQESDQEEYRTVTDAQGEALMEVGVMVSKNLRALFLLSDDPIEYGRAFVDGSSDHSATSTGNMVMIDPDGRIVHTAGIDGLRGRGNSTWYAEKKPYQLKLDAKVDLLDIGQPSKKWILLADAIDASLIRNIMTLDLARELGIESTPYAEHVDLYYDGQYRGTYLLCEKIEVGEWGVDELDYDKLLKKLNRRIGVNDLDALPSAIGENRFGNSINYTQGMAEANLPSSGAYFLETEGSSGNDENCWFDLNDGSSCVLKSPENATFKMVSYISERLTEAQDTLFYGGVNPETGRTVEEDFDVDGFARVALMHELAYNPDSYERSSFFVLPAGKTQFETGPIWDFDLSWRYRTNLANVNGRELQKMEGWLPAFYGVDSVWTKMGEIWREELEPLLQSVLLGEREGVHLRPIDAYAEHIQASRCMNDLLWDTHELSRLIYGVDYDEEIELLKSYITERSQWLGEQLNIRTVDPEQVDLRIQAEYLAFENLQVAAYPWSRAKVESFECSQLEEATEEDYALWQVEAVVSPAPGHVFENPVVTINGTQVDTERMEDGNLYVSVCVQDLSYRPADYYGDDMGIVFDADYYAAQHPEIAEELEYDRELLLEYFCDEGMYEGHMGNAFFNPMEVAQKNPYLVEMLGEDWWMYYTEFVSYGYEDQWLKDGKVFWPPVVLEME